MNPKPLIHIVEDDPMMCRSLARLFASVNLEAVCYFSPLDFLRDFNPGQPGCILIDIRLPGMSGLDLQAKIRERNWSHSIVFLTAHGDIAAAVRAMKAGAIDFVEKPFDDQMLIETVFHAVGKHLQSFEADQRLARIRERMDSLSRREREVLNLVVAGKSTKQIAAQLGLSHKTIDNHRANILDKMEATGVVELVRFALSAGPPHAGADQTSGTSICRTG